MRLIQRDPQTAYIDAWLWVPKAFCNVDATKSALEFAFPDSYSGGVRHVELWRETDHHILVPRSFWDPGSLPYKIVDLRPTSYASTGITSKVKLDHRWRRNKSGDLELMPTGDDVQRKSIAALMSSHGGCLQLACGKGKTCISLDLIARRGVPALIVIPDTTLMEQWKKELEALLDVPGGIGLMQAAKNDWKKFIVLTTYNTIGARCAEGMSEEIRRWFGLIIWDEGHHIPAPTFAASAEYFYGDRFSLTATPERDDGLHIISDFHIGRVLYKDLTQELQPDMVFRWTGLEIDEHDPSVRVRSKNDEIHLALLAAHCGRWLDRRNMVLDDIYDAVSAGRRALIISGSIEEICNLAQLYASGTWNTTQLPRLYSDIPVPHPSELGITVTPVELTNQERAALHREKESLEGAALNDPSKTAQCNALIQGIDIKLEAAAAFIKLSNELKKRQKKYITELAELLTDGSVVNECGILLGDVKPKVRSAFIQSKQVVFSIAKYGREGLDSPSLDTVFVSTGFSSRNTLQQLMGRIQRIYDGKKKPLVVFYEDNIGPVIGMCAKLKKWLREWPIDEGGPYDYEQIGHPKSARGTWQQNKTRIFG